MFVCARGILAEFEQEADVESLRAGLRFDAQRVADFEVQAVAQFPGDGDHFGIAQEANHVGLLVVLILELEGAERAVGEDIDAEDLEVLAREIGEAADLLHGGCGGGEIGMRGDGGPGFLIEAQAIADDLQVRLARHDIDRRTERFQCAVVDDLDAEKDRHAERDANDIERGEDRVPREIAEAVGEEKTEHEAAGSYTILLSRWSMPDADTTTNGGR